MIDQFLYDSCHYMIHVIVLSIRSLIINRSEIEHCSKGGTVILTLRYIDEFTKTMCFYFLFVIFLSLLLFWWFCLFLFHLVFYVVISLFLWINEVPLSECCFRYLFTIRQQLVGGKACLVSSTQHMSFSMHRESCKTFFFYFLL